MTSPLNVLMFPDYRESNPYQQALADALDAEAVSVTASDGKPPVLPLSRVVLAGELPDVVHMHFPSRYVIPEADRLWPSARFVVACLLGLQLLAELLLVRALGVRVVWTAHDLLNHERCAIPVEKAVKHVLVRAVVNDVIIHCDSAAELLGETLSLPEGCWRKFTVVPHGHFLDYYENDTDRLTARRELELGPDHTVFLFFGWIRRYKNVRYLIEAFGRLEAPDARLLVVGNPRTESLRREVAAAAAEDDRIRTRLEFIPGDAIQTYMNAADVVALPFRTDRQTMLTSGSVVLAMCFGRAVVTPRLGCIGSLVGDCRLLYDHDRQLGDALEVALEADLAAIGERNRRRIERHDWHSVARRTQAVYDGRSRAVDRRTAPDGGGC